jgi:hypothetical protein
MADVSQNKGDTKQGGSMVKSLLFVLVSLSLTAVAETTASHDFLAQKNLRILNANPMMVFERTADNPKSIFQRYKPKLDSGSRIVSPLQIGGTQKNPTVKVSIRKCVAIICQTVDLDATVSIQEVSGSCDRNFAMYADLRRSSPTLSDTYDRLDVSICYNDFTVGEAKLELGAYAHRAAKYSSGPIQREVLDFLQLQVQPIVQALAETLRANGSTAPLSQPVVLIY